MDLHLAGGEDVIAVAVQADRHCQAAQAGVRIVRYGAQISVAQGLGAHTIARIIMAQATGPDPLQFLLGQQDAPAYSLDGTVLDLRQRQGL
jgi:hypothetical protein